MIPLLLTRWRWGLGIAAALAMLGLLAAATHYRKAYHKQRDAVVAMQASIKQAREQWDIAFKLAESTSKLKAKRSVDALKVDLAEARSLADAYKLSNRLRPQAAVVLAGNQSVPGNGSAGLPAGGATDGIVVSEADFDACTKGLTTLRRAHLWGVDLDRANKLKAPVPEPDPGPQMD